MLLAGSIDAAFMGPGLQSVEATIERDPTLLENKDRFVILPKPFVRESNHLAFAKCMEQGEFLNRFNQAVRRDTKAGLSSGSSNAICGELSRGSSPPSGFRPG